MQKRKQFSIGALLSTTTIVSTCFVAGLQVIKVCEAARRVECPNIATSWSGAYLTPPNSIDGPLQMPFVVEQSVKIELNSSE